ncbi:MAG: RecX family transcriptional regulator [Victivallaceae bacterium]|nr:RecX family transcriptional regulator [Victivallaceae bacterium]
MDKRPVRRSALEEALRALDRTALTESRLREKLERFDFSPREIDDALEQCRRRRFIDDALFAENFRDELFRGGDGPRRIRMKLARRGVPADVIASTLAVDPDREIAACREACRKKLRSLTRESDPRKKREKLFRHLAARGFSASAAQKILAEIADGGQ